MIRRALAADASAIATIHYAAFRLALPTVRWEHTPDDVLRWVTTVVLPTCEVWVLEADPWLAGYIALHEDLVDQLYLAPAHWRRGIGSALMRHAKTLRPDGLRLWCFQVNARARTFYEHHGFVAACFTDGVGNEEREPDILYEWPGARRGAGEPAASAP